MNNFRMYNELKSIFKRANKKLIEKDKDLFLLKVSERTICGALMLHLSEALENSDYSSYYADVEFNRNHGSKLKTLVKTVKGPEYKIIKITCDLIVHSRGENIEQDNLIAIEMKKSYRKMVEKESDCFRLQCLTKDCFDDNILSYDGKILPEHVCRYVIGIYYEINDKDRSILLKYFYKGKEKEKEILSY